MQGIPENSTLMHLKNVLPSGVLGGDLPGNPMVTGSSESQSGSPKKNENGIKEHTRHRRFTSFKMKEDPSPGEAQAKLVKKNRMIARLDIVCLILFPIVFILYAAIYLMTTAM